MGQRAQTNEVGRVEVKGFVFRSFLTAIETMRGPASRAAVLARLDPAIRGHLDSGEIVAGGWYPIEWYEAFHVAAQAALGGGDHLAREIGRVSTEHDVRTLMRFVLGLLSPRLLFRYADKIWASYYRNARVEPDLSASAITLRLTARGMTPLVWLEIEGGALALLKLCKEVEETRVERLDDGRDRDLLVLRLEWTTS
jgi:hypothetical protein